MELIAKQFFIVKSFAINKFLSTLYTNV